MQLQDALRRVTEGGNLSHDEMVAVMRAIMTGEATPAQIGGFLIGLRMKGETVEEIAAAATVMRELAASVPAASVDDLLDTCGTGGDASGTINVSTAAAFVVSAAGVPVAKHGNRSVSGNSGSADVLEAAGARLDLTPEAVGESLSRLGVGFLFAPAHHSAMKHAIGPRKEMGVRTLFNVLGPLTNPAGARNQLLGVFGPQWVRPLAEVLRELGSLRVAVVHAEDGLDEVSISAPTHVAELRDGEVRETVWYPDDLGVQGHPLDALKVTGPEDSLTKIRAAFTGEPSPHAELIAANAGAALYVAGVASTPAEGVRQARDVLNSGAAAERLDAFAALTRELAD